MSIATRLLEDELAEERKQLEQGLAELSQRTRASLDWRTHFRDRPLHMLGAALVAGFVTGSIAGDRPFARSRESTAEDDNGRSLSTMLGDEWSKLAGSLVAVAGSRAVAVTEEIIRSVAQGYLDSRTTRKEDVP